MALPIHTSVNNVFIHVKDLKKAAEWYSTLLGLSFNPNQIESPVYNIPVPGKTGLTLDDHSFDPSFTFTRTNAVLFNFYAEDIDEAYNYVLSKNGKIVREIERIGSFAYFNFEDLDGNVLMICNN
ncbi:VOC family protein [Radiobacillus kanasensis]|uniref:VOC family protein n=1 Tax=Radiobacillus kanasensis TaxID=2844358 RepID=UPI001E5BC535|nr:VOC family protein [Radiobacillus kanasensis]UFU00660.1 VOC family protein [Radiobacillus kanasensis]